MAVSVPNFGAKSEMSIAKILKGSGIRLFPSPILGLNLKSRGRRDCAYARLVSVPNFGAKSEIDVKTLVELANSGFRPQFWG